MYIYYIMYIHVSPRIFATGLHCVNSPLPLFFLSSHPVDQRPSLVTVITPALVYLWNRSRRCSPLSQNLGLTFLLCATLPTIPYTDKVDYKIA